MPPRFGYAPYQGGVLRPLDRLDLPEGATVQVTVREAAWDERMDALLKRIREGGAGQVRADEIEAEITRACEEVRAERSGAT
jgi:predicted DNA-binding antitoxin AbrB/MazE fold protein